MLTRITNIKPHPDFSIDFTFSDGMKKHVDFKPFIGTDKLSAPLKDYGYFLKVKMYENGRGIYWPNEFDFCPDYLHDFVH
jgi:hypothetical protein